MAQIACPQASHPLCWETIHHKEELDSNCFHLAVGTRAGRKAHHCISPYISWGHAAHFRLCGSCLLIKECLYKLAWVYHAFGTFCCSVFSACFFITSPGLQKFSDLSTLLEVTHHLKRWTKGPSCVFSDLVSSEYLFKLPFICVDSWRLDMFSAGLFVKQPKIWESAVLLVIFFCCWFLGSLLAKNFFSSNLKRDLAGLLFVSYSTDWQRVRVQSAAQEMRQIKGKRLICVAKDTK